MVEGVVTWEQLVFVAGLTIAANATTAVFVGYIVYRVCLLIGSLQERLLRLEIEAQRRSGDRPRA